MRWIFSFIAILSSVSFADAQERQWSLNAAIQDASLEFGVEGTDDIGFSFYCEIGSGKVSMFLPASRSLIIKEGAVPVKLQVDDSQFDIFMQASRNESSRSGSLEGPVSVEGTVMKAINGARELGLTALNKTYHFPLVDADVDGFLKACTGEN